MADVEAGRVLLVLATSTGGIGQQVRALAGALVTRGWAVTVAGPAATERHFGFTALGAEFHPVEIAAGPRPLADLAAVHHLRRLLTRLGERTGETASETAGETADEITGPSASSETRVAGGLAAEKPAPETDDVTTRRLRPAESAEASAPDSVSSGLVVHAHGLRAGLLAGVAAGHRRPGRIPLVVTWHNAVLVRGAKGALFGALERRVAGAADVTLCASADLVDRARALGARDVRFAPVSAPPLAAPRRPRAQTRTELGADGRPVVLAVGRLAPQKGYDILLDAARGWTGTDPAPLVVIAGDGPLRGGLQARIDAERLPVRLLGHRDDVSDLLEACDIVVLPSVWEARALVAQEALRAARPLVATAVGGLPELVGDAAVLVPYGDPVALRDQVLRLLDDAEERARLAAAGREQAATWPPESDTVSQVVAVYGEVVRP